MLAHHGASTVLMLKFCQKRHWMISHFWWSKKNEFPPFHLFFNPQFWRFNPHVFWWNPKDKRCFNILLSLNFARSTCLILDSILCWLTPRFDDWIIRFFDGPQIPCPNVSSTSPPAASASSALHGARHAPERSHATQYQSWWRRARTLRKGSRAWGLG